MLRKKRADLRPRGPTNFWIGVRLQTRFDYYPGQNPSAADLRLERDSELDLNWGRLKGARHSAPIGWTYTLSMTSLAMTCSTWKLGEQLFLRLGQWRSDFNRERIDSSDRQQMTERSISSY